MLLLLISGTFFTTQAQMQVATASIQNSNPNAQYYFAELKDGKTVFGEGQVKIKNGSSKVEIKSPEGKEVSLVPSQVKLLSHAVRSGKEALINFEDKYWLYKLNPNIEAFYQTAGESDLLFIKDNGKYRLAVKEDIIDLVKDNKEAYKFAKKGKVKKSLTAYINENIKPAADKPEGQ